jgi:hypothetical protein
MSTCSHLVIIYKLTCRRQQLKISDNAAAALMSLRGNDWGQHGEVVFFLQGAYRDKENAVKTFK